MTSEFKHDIFISYYHEDEEKVRLLFERMKDFGLTVFWSPKTLERGIEFPGYLGDAVLSSQHFAVYWSQTTSKSKWVSKECEMFFSSCHLPDKANRRMYVLLEPPCSPDDLPGLLQDLNRPNSIEELVTEVVKTVLIRSKQDVEQASAKQERVLSDIQEELKQHRRKVEEAQNYYRYNRFWGQISANRDVHIFTCARDLAYDSKSSRGYGGRTNIDLWDYRAVLDITRFLAANYPNVRVTIEDPVSKLHGEDLEKLTRLADRMSDMRSKLENKDCIIIGSPDVNDFAEIVLAEIHQIDPYTESREKRKGFVAIKERKGTRSSFYWQKEEKEEEGVAQIMGPGQYDPFPHKLATETSPGTMFGILIVANNPFCQEGIRRKIIILSGFSGVATNAIAKILTDEKCLGEFFKLDNAYVDTNQDVEALIGIEYAVDGTFTNRDARQIRDYANTITFVKLAEIHGSQGTS